MTTMMIFMIIDLIMAIVLVIKLFFASEIIEEKLDEIIERLDEKSIELPPIDKPMELSKEEAEVLQSLADMLSFNGELPDKE